MIQNRNIKQFSRNHRCHPCPNAQDFTFRWRNTQCPALARRLAYQSLAQRDRSGIGWTLHRERPDSVQSRLGIVGQIKRSIEEGDAFRKSREKCRSERVEILSGSQPHGRSCDLRLHPGLRLSFLRPALKRAQRPADLTDFIRAFEIRNRTIQFAPSDRVDRVPHIQQFLDQASLKLVRRQHESHKDSDADHKPCDIDRAMSFESEFG